MAKYFTLVLLVVALCSADEDVGEADIKMDTPQYLITSPYNYRMGYEETIGVHLFGSRACEVEVWVKNAEISMDKSVFSSDKAVFQPGKRGTLRLKIPDVSDKTRRYYRYYFELQAKVCGKETEKKRVYASQQGLNNMFIQTDKPIYKPGQKVHIRVISVDKDLKPYGDMLQTIHVVAGGSRIKQWNNVTLEDGLASFEIQLSKEPVMGIYTITAILDDKNKKTQAVEVAKYVLPKFEVKIKPPPYLAMDMKEFTTSICAIYTYGKNVKGTLNAELCLKHWKYIRREGRYNRRNFDKCENITKMIDGCTDVTLSRETLNVANMTNPNRWNVQFTVDASVTETLTDVTLKSYQETRNFFARSTQMSFHPGTSNKFKPGLPFKYILKVTRPDGTPSTRANVRVTISRGWYGKQHFYNKTFVVTNGLIEDSIDDATYNARSLVFRAELLDKNPFPVSKDSRFNYPVTTTFTAQPWFSPTFSYLEILKTKNTPAKIGSEASLTVRYTVRNDTAEDLDFHYSVMCKRDIVLTGKRSQHHDYIQKQKVTTQATTTASTTTSTTAENPTTSTGPIISSTNTTTNTSMNSTTISMRRYIWRWWTPKPDPVKKLDSKPVVEKFEIKFPVTMEMTPSCKIMVYYVREDDEVVADTIDFDVEDKLENQVSVSFENDERKPGEKTKLILKATPGSRVAFVAVDMSVHLLRSGNEINKNKVLSYLKSQELGRAWSYNPKCEQRYWGRRKRDIIGPYGPYWGHGSDYEDASEAFDIAGLVFLSNLSIHTTPCPRGQQEYEESSVTLKDSGDVEATRTTGIRPKSGPDKKPRVRKEFPETWLWADEKLDDSGNKKIEVTVPDTITTWVANGFAMSSKTGMGVSDTAKLKGFQPFFVSMTLPYSVIRGEEIPVIVTVFNYMPSCAPIVLRMDHRSRDYKVTSYYLHKLCVCGDAGQSVKFTIIPTKIGKIPLTVTATTSSSTKLCPESTVAVNDAVSRKLLVEPEGVRLEYTKGTFFCPGSKEYTEVFDLQLPTELVPGSIYPTVTIIGDIMGPALNNLEDLLRMPYGCGEQNMANFAPNIYIMDYLTKTHQVTAGIKSKAIHFMESGYQRELGYKRKSGSYSAFGDSDAKGSMMLTAFVVRSFASAKKYIFVDDEEVKHSLEWFKTKQNKSTGCFASYGKVLHRGLQGGVNSELTITAYITTALLESGESNDSEMVSSALKCITSQLESIKESYAMALVTYTLTLANHADAEKMMKLLKQKAIKNGDQMYWTEENKPKPTREYWYYYPSSVEVQTTGYALLSILHQNDGQSVVTNEIMDIIRWLSKQRNSYGGFASTQDTCIALQALSEFAGRAYGDNADFRSSQLSGSLSMGNYYNHDFVITKDNKLTLQTVELPPKIIPGRLQVSGNGVGCALVQASVKYNVPEPEKEPAFDIKVDVRTRRSSPDEESTPCRPLRLHITTKWLKEDVSNMAVVDVKLVTGFSVREESLEKLINDVDLNFKRYDIDGQNVMLYFDEIKDMSFSIDIHQDTLVKKLKPAVIKVYDYYEPESQAKVMYKIGENECYGNRVDAECPKCVTLEDPEDLIKATVQCNSTVTRMRSSQGMLKVKKSYSKSSKKMVSKEYKSGLEYQLPEFCPCDEIHDRTVSIVIGQNNYFKQDGKKMMVVLNSGTTIFKWTGKPMKKQIKVILSKLNACSRRRK